MTDIRFLTHEIGSLAKPPWLVKTNSGRSLDSSDLDHARRWGEKVGVPGYEELIALLEQPERDPDEVARWSSKYALRLLEHAGVDLVYDGEQQRSEMYAWAVAHANGFEARHRSQLRQQVLHEVGGRRRTITLREPYHNAEFAFLQSAAQHELKIPITGAYTLAVWSYDEHYAPAAVASASARAAPVRSPPAASSPSISHGT